MKRLITSALLPLSAATLWAGMFGLTPQEELGKHLFFDRNLSLPAGQSCGSCHGPEMGFTGPISPINAAGAVHPGAIPTRFGNRKPPSAAYAAFSPPFHFDPVLRRFVGGQFWDGRAADLVEQAKAPFLNPLEQNCPDPGYVVRGVARSRYSRLFNVVYGPGSLDPGGDPLGSYHRVAESIAAYERSDEVNPFTSKFDYWVAGLVQLTPQENLGRQLFNREDKGRCATCHPSTPGPFSEHALFTNYQYDNIGMPRNPLNPFYTMPFDVNPLGFNWVDLGLGFTTGRRLDAGKFKVPTLRNVDKRPFPGFVKAYGHNGYFKSLKEIVHFYNTRDVAQWPPPEVASNLNKNEMGNLGLTDAEEDALVAFLRTLSDGFQLP